MSISGMSMGEWCSRSRTTTEVIDLWLLIQDHYEGKTITYTEEERKAIDWFFWGECDPRFISYLDLDDILDEYRRMKVVEERKQLTEVLITVDTSVKRSRM